MKPHIEIFGTWCLVIILAGAGCGTAEAERMTLGEGSGEDPVFAVHGPSGDPGGGQSPSDDGDAFGGPGGEDDPDDDPGCQDQDGDGAGPGCELGADCDDGNPHFTKSCPDCSTLLVEGCPCDAPGAGLVCYEGPIGTVGVGACTDGHRFCVNDHWGPCHDQVVPQDEICDDLDNDCDEEIDEGVLSPCGDCDPDCDGFDLGPDTPLPFLPGEENSEGVGLTEEGWLVLDSDEIDLSLIWIANSGEGTVSKLDTKTGNELGRYATCGDPSRTSVDLFGDVWVACRADGGVAKILRHELACPDKNGNGVVDTSRDLDGDGQISGGEMLPAGQDECIKFIVYPGGAVQRAAGVDSENHCWVGDWDAAVLRRLHPDDGSVVQSISIPNNPYGLVVDGDNIIWVAGRGGGRLVRVDPTTGQVDAYQSPYSETSPYGITLDNKGRIWVANCCSNHAVYRFDPATAQWSAAPTLDRPRGIAGSTDGHMYVANDQANSVAIIDADTMANLGQIDLGSGRFPVGMAVDFDGYIWAVNQSSSSATRIDPATGQIMGEHPVGQAPYTYSDMTGYTLHNFTAPQGHYDVTLSVLDGFGSATAAGDDGVLWTEVDLEVDTPPGSQVGIEVRSATTPGALAEATWQGPLGPFPPATLPATLTTLGEPLVGKLLEVRVWLYSTDNMATPVVKKVKASFSID